MQIRKYLLLFLGIFIIPLVNAQEFDVGEPTLFGGIILGVIMLSAIFAFLATKSSEEHPFLKLFFFFLTLITLTISVIFMVTGCNTYMTSTGICDLVGAYSNNMIYVFLVIPFAYMLIYAIWLVKNNIEKANKEKEDYNMQSY